MPERKNFLHKNRNGLSSLELVVSALLLSSLIGLTASLVAKLHRIGQETSHRQMALQELANVLDEVLVSDRTELTDYPLPESIQKVWPSALLEIHRETDANGQRFMISLYFDSDRKQSPVQLVGWRFDSSTLAMGGLR